MGVGSGWNQDELAHHGTDFKSRHKVLHERIEAMRIIWSQEVAEYHGAFVDFNEMKTWPKPVQQPGPPIYVGGEFPYGARRTLAFGDGWLPHAKRPKYDLLDILPQFRQMESEHGRDPGSTPVSVFGPDPDADVIARYREADVERLIFNLAPEGEGSALTTLDTWAKLIA